MILLIACGRTRDWRRNVALCVGVLALFISGLLSAPFTFLFTTPAYIMICTALIVMRRPPPAEWAWKIAALLMCLISFFASGLFDYYLGTVATAGRTPSAGITLCAKIHGCSCASRIGGPACRLPALPGPW
jgi:hypothetical protein